MSGYTDCACRDCFNVAIDGVCSECETAGCDLTGECEAPGAYGMDEGYSHPSMKVLTFYEKLSVSGMSARLTVDIPEHSSAEYYQQCPLCNHD